MTPTRRTLLVIEDGDEYEEFARLFLAEDFDVLAAKSAREAIEIAGRETVNALLIDLRFDRSPTEDLIGDLSEIAGRLFGGDEKRALRYLQDNQGTLVLGALRTAGVQSRAVFVHDFSPRRLGNLEKLYGNVRAVSSFDGRMLREAFL